MDRVTDVAATKDLAVIRDVAATPTIGHVEKVASTAGVTEVVPTLVASEKDTPKAIKQRLPSLTH